jgi:hypothetical protein
MSLFLLGIVPLALASLHWSHLSLKVLVGVNPFLPCLIGLSGIALGCMGKSSDLKLYLITLNLLSILLYLIFGMLTIENIQSSL